MSRLLQATWTTYGKQVHRVAQHEEPQLAHDQCVSRSNVSYRTFFFWCVCMCVENMIGTSLNLHISNFIKIIGIFEVSSTRLR
jgi:hypothetical protein